MALALRIQTEEGKVVQSNSKKRNSDKTHSEKKQRKHNDAIPRRRAVSSKTIRTVRPTPTPSTNLIFLSLTPRKKQVRSFKKKKNKQTGQNLKTQQGRRRRTGTRKPRRDSSTASERKGACDANMQCWRRERDRVCARTLRKTGEGSSGDR